MSPQPGTKSVVPRSFGAPRAWRFLGAPLRGASLLGDFAKSPGDRGSPPGSRVLSCSCVCLSVSQSLAVRLLARDSQALQLKPSCLWFSGCVSGTRLSLKPLIYHQENNQICPGAPSSPTLPPPSPPPPGPPLSLPSLFFSSYYHHSFLSLSLVPLSLPWPGHPSSSFITPSPPSPLYLISIKWF